MFELTGNKPIYLQIAEWLENEILRGNIKAGGRLPSHADIAEAFDVNPLTAGKSVGVLEARGVIEKRRRGCGIYVLNDAKNRIYEYRKNAALNEALDNILVDASVLGLSVDDLCEMLRKRGGGQ